MEVEAHGQELTTEFLDHLFVSILKDIPDGKWIEIKKNHDQVKAGIKHLIDMEFYGAKLVVVFNNEFTHFKKQVEIVPHKPVFEGKYIDETAYLRRNEIDANEALAVKRNYEREKKRSERESKPKRRGNRR